MTFDHLVLRADRDKKHEYRIDLKVTNIQSVIVSANTKTEAKALALEAFKRLHPTGYEWITFGHCAIQE